MTYEYACNCCNHQFEIEQSIKDKPLEECPRCLVAALKRLISGGIFVLKGDGWYRDGYSGPSNSNTTGDS